MMSVIYQCLGRWHGWCEGSTKEVEDMKTKTLAGWLLRALGTVITANGFSSGTFATDSFSTLAAAATVPEKRTALVIGNASYEHSALKNPLNDARAIAREL